MNHARIIYHGILYGWIEDKIFKENSIKKIWKIFKKVLDKWKSIVYNIDSKSNTP
jgi:hypothetical protein